MQRIMLIGSGGSGKSTLARKLGDLLQIEVFHLDWLYWKPGWVQTPKDEWTVLQEQMVGKDKWIIDGNYTGTMEQRLDAADTIIFFDLPRIVCLWRVIKRRCRYIGKVRPDMGEGCPERLNAEFIRWVWSYPEKVRPKVLRMLEKHGDKTIVTFHHVREIRKWLNKIKKEI